MKRFGIPTAIFLAAALFCFASCGGETKGPKSSDMTGVSEHTEMENIPDSTKLAFESTAGPTTAPPSEPSITKPVYKLLQNEAGNYTGVRFTYVDGDTYTWECPVESVLPPIVRQKHLDANCMIEYYTGGSEWLFDWIDLNEQTIVYRHKNECQLSYTVGTVSIHSEVHAEAKHELGYLDIYRETAMDGAPQITMVYRYNFLMRESGDTAATIDSISNAAVWDTKANIYCDVLQNEMGEYTGVRFTYTDNSAFVWESPEKLSSPPIVNLKNSRAVCIEYCIRGAEWLFDWVDLDQKSIIYRHENKPYLQYAAGTARTVSDACIQAQISCEPGYFAVCRETLSGDTQGIRIIYHHHFLSLESPLKNQCVPIQHVLPLSGTETVPEKPKYTMVCTKYPTAWYMKEDGNVYGRSNIDPDTGDLGEWREYLCFEGLSTLYYSEASIDESTVRQIINFERRFVHNGYTYYTSGWGEPLAVVVLDDHYLAQIHAYEHWMLSQESDMFYPDHMLWPTIENLSFLESKDANASLLSIVL